MMSRHEARVILHRCRIPLGANFHKLDSATVESLLVEAKARRYRKARNAPGSTGRMFCEYLQRRAQSECDE